MAPRSTQSPHLLDLAPSLRPKSVREAYDALTLELEAVETLTVHLVGHLDGCSAMDAVNVYALELIGQTIEERQQQIRTLVDALYAVATCE